MSDTFFPLTLKLMTACPSHNAFTVGLIIFERANIDLITPDLSTILSLRVHKAAIVPLSCEYLTLYRLKRMIKTSFTVWDPIFWQLPIIGKFTDLPVWRDFMTWRSFGLSCRVNLTGVTTEQNCLRIVCLAVNIFIVGVRPWVQLLKAVLVF